MRESHAFPYRNLWFTEGPFSFYNATMTESPVAASYRSRKRKLILGVAFFLFAGMVVVVRQSRGQVPVSTSTEMKGQFVISYRTYDFMGHRASRKTIYHRGVEDREVASDVVSFVVPEREPGRLFYQLCPDREDPACATYYYDAKLGRSSKIASYRLSLSDLDEEQAWSPNSPYGSYVALASVDGDEAVIVNLATGNTLDVGRMLVPEPPFRTVRFGSWRPDAAIVVALVTNNLARHVTSRRFEEDLFLIDAKEGAIEYVASAAPRGWRPEDYKWRKSGLSWAIAAHPRWPATAGPEGIRRKRPGELPHLRANPANRIR